MKKVSETFVNLGMKLVCSKAAQFVLNRVFDINTSNFKMGFIREADGRWYTDIKH